MMNKIYCYNFSVLRKSITLTMSQAKRGRMDDRMGEESSSEEEVTIIYESVLTLWI